PARERGLKPSPKVLVMAFRLSLPARERGLKHRTLPAIDHPAASLPARERGLKLVDLFRVDLAGRSLPARERGLKPAGVAAPGSAASGRSPRGSVGCIFLAAHGIRDHHRGVA